MITIDKNVETIDTSYRYDEPRDYNISELEKMLSDAISYAMNQGEKSLDWTAPLMYDMIRVGERLTESIMEAGFHGGSYVECDGRLHVRVAWDSKN